MIMDQSPPDDERQLEELKKRRGFDEKIAEKYEVPVHRVEADFDPRIVKLISDFLYQKAKR